MGQDDKDGESSPPEVRTSFSADVHTDRLQEAALPYKTIVIIAIIVLVLLARAVLL